MNHEPTEIYRADSTHQAHLLVSLLKDHGIEALVINDVQAVAGGELPLGWPSLARIVVPLEQAAAARQLVLKFEDDRREGKLLAADVDEVEQVNAWPDWPLCPQCGQKRQALCVTCGSAGTEFPLVDVERRGGEELVLLYCPSCDDHFKPQFYRRCHACGHDFAEGVRAASDGGIDVEPVSLRIWLAIGMATTVVVGILAYFAWLLR